MKLLIDENLPKRLKKDFVGHDVYTVREKGWNGIKNGKLLSLMLDDRFDALLTFDKNLQYQQNFETFPISVIVLTASDNQYTHISPLVPQIQKILSEPLKKGVIIVR